MKCIGLPHFWFLISRAIIGTLDAINRMAKDVVQGVVAHDILANETLVEAAGTSVN